MRPKPCPTGHVRHGTQEAARAASTAANQRRQLRAGRYSTYHCPDCSGWHTIATSLGTIRRRNPRMKARLARQQHDAA